MFWNLLPKSDACLRRIAKHSIKKHTTSFLWFLYPHLRQAWTNSTALLLSDGSGGISSSGEKGDKKGKGVG